MNISGEALEAPLVHQLYEQTSIKRIYNLYGVSEASTYSTCAYLEPGFRGPPPIGRPIANTQIYLLDRNRQPVPIGVVGEMYVGGAGVARGYVNRPQLTAERFIPHPFSDESGARLYRTGDLARFRPDGQIEYLGRGDHQSRCRGCRVEPGEVEAVLVQHPWVQDAVVVPRRDRGCDRVLVAMSFPGRRAVAGASDLRAFLGGKLPGHMVPLGLCPPCERSWV